MDTGAACDGLWLGEMTNRGVQQELANMPTDEGDREPHCIAARVLVYICIHIHVYTPYTVRTLSDGDGVGSWLAEINGTTGISGRASPHNNSIIAIRSCFSHCQSSHHHHIATENSDNSMQSSPKPALNGKQQSISVTIYC